MEQEKFCRICGRPLDPYTGRCPACQPMPAPQAPKSQNKGLIATLIAVGAAVVLAIVALIVVLLLPKGEREVHTSSYTATTKTTEASAPTMAAPETEKPAAFYEDPISTHNPDLYPSYDPSLYRPYVENAINEQLEWSSGDCLLYDIDGNGVHELIMAYSANNGGEANCMVCTLLTQSDGEVQSPFFRYPMYYEVGAAYGQLGVVSLNGRTYFAVNEINGEDGMDYYTQFGTWKLWDVTNLTGDPVYEVSFDYAVSFTDGGVLPDSAQISANGEAWTYAEYSTWVDFMQWLGRIDGRASSYGDSDNGMGLEDMIHQLS